MPPYDFVFVVGIRSNFLGLLPDAMRQAADRRLSATILDVHRVLPGVSQYPNDWDSVGLSGHVTPVADEAAIHTFASRQAGKSTHVVFLYPPDRHLRRIWKIFAGRGAKVGAMLLSPMPTSRWTTGGRRRSFYQRAGLFIKARRKPRPDFIVVSGSVCAQVYGTYFKTLKGVKTVFAHSIEYELSTRSHEDDRSHVDTLAVLEQGWFSKPRPPFVSEHAYPPMSRERYQQGMSVLLDRLEQYTGLKAVICAHPKADRQATQALFDGREVVFGKSMSVVKQCSLVVAHNSTSLVYAVIYKKPALLFDSVELRDSIFRESFSCLNEELALPVVDLDETGPLETLDLQIPDAGRYETFSSRYITQNPDSSDSIWSKLYDQLPSRA